MFSALALSQFNQFKGYNAFMGNLAYNSSYTTSLNKVGNSIFRQESAVRNHLWSEIFSMLETSACYYATTARVAAIWHNLIA